MCRLNPSALFMIAVAAVSAVAWSQTTDPLNGTNVNGAPGVDQTLNDRSPNPTSDLGTSNPLSGGTATNPTLGSDPALRAVDPGNRIDGTTGPENGRNPDFALNNSGVNNSGVAQNDWRMVQHNGRWWYWTPNNTWLYRRGDQWMAFVPRSMDQRRGTGQFDTQQRYESGYRGEGTLQNRTQQNEALMQNEMNLRGGVGVAGGGLRANANTPGFGATRPLSPTANELQGFYRQQGIQATPFGGTTGGVPNATIPLGGGTYRSGTGAGTSNPASTAPLAPQSAAPGASPTTSSPGNPGAVGSPGNPAASGAAGTGTGAGGSVPAAGTGDAAGASAAGGTGS